MQTIQIDNAELKSFISLQYGNDETELIENDIKKGFDEVELYKKGELELQDARDMLKELRSAC